MTMFLHSLGIFASVLISVLEFAMLGRALISLLGLDEENKLAVFLFTLTEPIILPIRNLLYRLNWFQDFPLDMAFFFTAILLSVIGTLFRFLM